MPTARMRTSTSSGAICGSASSLTSSSNGLLITSAFMVGPQSFSSLVVTGKAGPAPQLGEATRSVRLQ